jgi:hypothetical protein
MSKPTPTLDPATLRWVADELDREARIYRRWAGDTTDADSRDAFLVRDGLLTRYVRRLRARATRTERGK